MSSPASVAADEQPRIRLFCALRLPPGVLEGLDRWRRAELDRRDIRLPAADRLHLTLAFLGHRPQAEVPAIAGALRDAASGAPGPIVFRARRYGETRSVGMLVLDDEEGRAGALAGDLHRRLEALRVYEPEARPWLPHVTVIRFRRPPRLRPPVPDLGAFCPSDAAVYHSVLRSGGAQYEVIESVALGG